jgi:methionyl-tRNA formyltransferase
MKVAFFGNNSLGARVLAWLVTQDVSIAALVLHPEARRRFGPELLSAARLSEADVIDGSALRTRDTMDRLRASGATLGLSVMFGYILPREVIDLFPGGCFNLHPAFLPMNRGADPNVWSIIENTPAGVTLHWMDEGIDTGDIVAQELMEVEPVDTGRSLYVKLEDACFDLFCRTWPLLRDGTAPRIPQRGDGTYHRRADLRLIDLIDLDREYRARDLIDLLRARSFKPYRGASFEAAGRKVRVHIELEYDDEGEA